MYDIFLSSSYPQLGLYIKYISLPFSIPPSPSYYSVAIFCKLGIDGFIGSIVLFIFMLIVQIIGIFLVDKVNM